MHEMKVIQKFNGYSLKTLFYTESSVVCEDLFFWMIMRMACFCWLWIFFKFVLTVLDPAKLT